MHIAIMPEKQPKRPNNNAKALESWESEGGAPASDDCSTKRKRARLEPDCEGSATHESQAKTEEELEPRSLFYARARSYPCARSRLQIVESLLYCIAGYSYPEVWCLRTRT
jgi:hypothetical protein